jgi:membrane protein implicated in regulation of membrane protease activity
MELDSATVWWIAAGLLVGVELFTGTIYLLLLALGLVSAGLAAWAGGAVALQMLVAAGVGGGAMLALRAWRRRHAAPVPGTANPAQHIDIGLHVHVAHWRADGTATVQYRGAPWTVRCATGALPAGAVNCVIVAVDGTALVVRPLSSFTVTGGS